MSAATPIFIKLFGAALQRGVSYVFQKISRLKKIDLALKGEIDNANIKTAIHDFETRLSP
jgi:hypothetical protein